MKASITMTAMLAALSGVACLALTVPANAQRLQRPEPTFIADVISPYEAFRMVRSAGFSPVGRPVYHRGIYVLRAFDRHGEMMRVVVDAQMARIVSVAPAARLAQNVPPYQRRYDSGPPPSDPRQDPYQDPRYVPAPGPYYDAPQGVPEEAWPDDDDDDEGPSFDVPDDDEEDDDARIRSVPPRETVQVPRGQGEPARSAAVTPAKTLAKTLPQPPLPRPRPQIAQAETPDAGAAQNAAPDHSDPPKPPIRVIEIKKPEKPEPRI